MNKKTEIVLSIYQNLYGKHYKLTVDFPHNQLGNELKSLIIDEITLQLYNILTKGEKIEWLKNDHKVKLHENRIELEIIYPDNIDENNLMEIQVNSNYIRNLNELKTIIVYLDRYAEELELKED